MTLQFQTAHINAGKALNLAKVNLASKNTKYVYEEELTGSFYDTNTQLNYK